MKDVQLVRNYVEDGEFVEQLLLVDNYISNTYSTDLRKHGLVPLCRITGQTTAKVGSYTMNISKQFE